MKNIEKGGQATRAEAGGAETSSASASPTKPIEPRTLLLVEDDVTTSRAIRVLLTHYGWQSYVAETIADANLYLDAHVPEVVLLDLMLPDGDGTAVLHRIREQRLACRVTVVTAVHDHQMLKRVAALNPAALLRKPIDLMELLSSLGQDNHDPLAPSEAQPAGLIACQGVDDKTKYFNAI